MGCLTYIGNGPNLMVKEIAEHRGIRMPNFFAYALIALTIMVPVLSPPRSCSSPRSDNSAWRDRRRIRALSHVPGHPGHPWRARRSAT